MVIIVIISDNFKNRMIISVNHPLNPLFPLLLLKMQTKLINPRRSLTVYFTKVKKVVRHNKKVSTLYFDLRITSYPGQFVMLYLPGYEEIPLSLSSSNSVTVKAVGETTQALVKAHEGLSIGLRGAFGNPFSPSDKALIIAGGIGIAPMKYLHEFLKKCGAEVKMIYGEKSKEDLIWLSEFEELTITTEDGTAGIKGTVLEAVKKEDLSKYSRIYACGSEEMLKALYTVLKKAGVLHKAEFSLERYMRCGIGVCGSCVIENGMRVCTDGPVFPATVIGNL